jgi:ankyrin repeat protein
MPSKTKLSAAIQSLDKQALQKIISHNKLLLRGTYGTTVLSEATQVGNIEIVSILVQAGAEINDEDNVLPSDEIPISIASIQGYTDIVKYLLKSGAEVNHSSGDPEYWTPLMCAVAGKNLDIVKMLVEAGANPNEVRDGGNFALLIATEEGCEEIFNYLYPITSSELQDRID